MIFNFILVIVAILCFVGYQFINAPFKKAEKARLAALDKYQFSIEQKIESQIIGIIEDEKKFVCIGFNGSIREIPFSKILELEVLKDGESVSKLSVQNTIVGGVLGGGIGAFIGSNVGKKTKTIINSIDFKLTIDELVNPSLKLNFYTKNDNLSRLNYILPTIDKWEGIFKVIIDRNKKTQE